MVLRKGSLIGNGAFGYVHRSFDENGRMFATKYPRDDLTEDEIRRFKREVELMSRLEHRNIMPIVARNLKSSPHRFTMPYAEMNLEDYFSDCEDRTIRLDFFRQISSGLEYAHANNVIHRDLKPRNILILSDDDGVPYPVISDFGIGKDLDSESTRITSSGTPLGTAVWAAPEQLDDANSADERSDIHALGRILFFAVTGSIPALSMDYERLPPGYRHIVEKACKNNADQRYQQVAELIRDLNLVEGRRRLLGTAEEILEEIRQLSDEVPSQERLESLLDTFMTADDETVIDLLPRVPEDLLRIMNRVDPSRFREVIVVYDEAVSEELPWTYCDVVADFYWRVYSLTDDIIVKRIIIGRLPILGYNHNRYYVRRVFGRLVPMIRQDDLVLHARAVLLENPRAASWCSSDINRRSIDPAISAVLPGGSDYIEAELPNDLF